MKNILYHTTFYIMFSMCYLYPVDKTGTTSAKFLSIGAGSAAVGMGGAFTSVANDATAMYWNPAGISFYNMREVYFNHSNWIADISHDYFGLTIPLNSKNTIGFNLISVTMDDMEVTRYGNEDTGETFKAADYALGVSYAVNFTDRFSIGFNGKYIQQMIASSYARGLALDIGTLFDTPFGFRLGTSISNFGPKLKMTGDDLLVAADVDQTIEGNNESVISVLSTDYFDLPLVLRFGISDNVKVGKLLKMLWSVDAVSPNDNTNYINIGLEFSFLNDLLRLRSGINSLFLSDNEKEFSLGLGLKIPSIGKNNILMNYSYESMKFLGVTQQIGISFAY